MKNTVAEHYERIFTSRGRVFCAPGRINLIGEHTDYNNGFVLPASITNSIYGMILPNGSDLIRLYSVDFDQFTEFKIGKNPPDEQWTKYIYGVIELMRNKGKVIGGFNCVFGGDIPLGAGLSSSAALENLLSYSLNKLFNLGFSNMELAKIGQECEHKYVGVKFGIMDQFISMFGKDNSVVLLDCRSLSYEYKPFEISGYRLVLIDTLVKHSLASSEYNHRREDCERGVEILAKYDSQIKSLRDLTIELLEEHKSELGQTVYNRCKYVVQENNRVLSACEALEKGNIEEFGKYMDESHKGLKLLYNVSCAELDTLARVQENYRNN